MSSTFDKTALRKHFRDLRRQLTMQQQDIAANGLNQLVQTQHMLQPNQTVALYLANDGELNCRPLIEWCWQQSIQVTLPVIHPFNPQFLLFLLFTPETPMVKNKFGIKEPKLDVTQLVPLNHLTTIFLPLVAFDDDGNRLGMGGGFYDRTLCALTSQKNNNDITFVGVAHECQNAHKLAVDKWDVKMDKIITPSRVICPEN